MVNQNETKIQHLSLKRDVRIQGWPVWEGCGTVGYLLGICREFKMDFHFPHSDDFFPRSTVWRLERSWWVMLFRRCDILCLWTVPTLTDLDQPDCQLCLNLTLIAGMSKWPPILAGFPTQQTSKQDVGLIWLARRSIIEMLQEHTHPTVHGFRIQAITRKLNVWFTGESPFPGADFQVNHVKLQGGYICIWSSISFWHNDIALDAYIYCTCSLHRKQCIQSSM